MSKVRISSKKVIIENNRYSPQIDPKANLPYYDLDLNERYLNKPQSADLPLKTKNIFDKSYGLDESTSIFGSTKNDNIHLDHHKYNIDSLIKNNIGEISEIARPETKYSFSVESNKKLVERLSSSLVEHSHSPFDHPKQLGFNDYRVLIDGGRRVGVSPDKLLENERSSFFRRQKEIEDRIAQLEKKYQTSDKKNSNDILKSTNSTNSAYPENTSIPIDDNSTLQYSPTNFKIPLESLQSQPSLSELKIKENTVRSDRFVKTKPTGFSNEEKKAITDQHQPTKINNQSSPKIEEFRTILTKEVLNPLPKTQSPSPKNFEKSSPKQTSSKDNVESAVKADILVYMKDERACPSGIFDRDGFLHKTLVGNQQQQDDLDFDNNENFDFQDFEFQQYSRCQKDKFDNSGMYFEKKDHQKSNKSPNISPSKFEVSSSPKQSQKIFDDNSKFRKEWVDGVTSFPDSNYLYGLPSNSPTNRIRSPSPVSTKNRSQSPNNQNRLPSPESLNCDRLSTHSQSPIHQNSSPSPAQSSNNQNRSPSPQSLNSDRIPSQSQSPIHQNILPSPAQSSNNQNRSPSPQLHSPRIPSQPQLPIHQNRSPSPVLLNSGRSASPIVHKPSSPIHTNNTQSFNSQSPTGNQQQTPRSWSPSRKSPSPHQTIPKNEPIRQKSSVWENVLGLVDIDGHVLSNPAENGGLKETFRNSDVVVEPIPLKWSGVGDEFDKWQHGIDLGLPYGQKESVSDSPISKFGGFYGEDSAGYGKPRLSVSPSKGRQEQRFFSPLDYDHSRVASNQKNSQIQSPITFNRSFTTGPVKPGSKQVNADYNEPPLNINPNTEYHHRQFSQPVNVSHPTTREVLSSKLRVDNSQSHKSPYHNLTSNLPVSHVQIHESYIEKANVLDDQFNRNLRLPSTSNLKKNSRSASPVLEHYDDTRDSCESRMSRANSTVCFQQQRRYDEQRIQSDLPIQFEPPTNQYRNRDQFEKSRDFIDDQSRSSVSPADHFQMKNYGGYRGDKFERSRSFEGQGSRSVSPVQYHQSPCEKSNSPKTKQYWSELPSNWINSSQYDEVDKFNACRQAYPRSNEFQYHQSNNEIQNQQQCQRFFDNEEFKINVPRKGPISTEQSRSQTKTPDLEYNRKFRNSNSSIRISPSRSITPEVRVSGRSGLRTIDFFKQGGVTTPKKSSFRCMRKSNSYLISDDDKNDEVLLFSPKHHKKSRQSIKKDGKKIKEKFDFSSDGAREFTRTEKPSRRHGSRSMSERHSDEADIDDSDYRKSPDNRRQERTEAFDYEKVRMLEAALAKLQCELRSVNEKIQKEQFVRSRK